MTVCFDIILLHLYSSSHKQEQEARVQLFFKNMFSFYLQCFHWISLLSVFSFVVHLFNYFPKLFVVSLFLLSASFWYFPGMWNLTRDLGREHVSVTEEEKQWAAQRHRPTAATSHCSFVYETKLYRPGR